MSTRVLFFPHNARRDYFLRLLKNFKEEAGWRIGVISPESAKKAYQGIVADGDFYCEPDLIRRMDWEAEPSQRKKIDNVIKDCEDLTGISANRILLAGERDMGRAFSREFYYWPSTKLNSMCVSDSENTVGVLRRLFSFVMAAFEHFQPDMILFGITSAPLHFAGSLLAERMGIPFVVNRQSKIHSKRVYWTTDRMMLNELARKTYEEKRISNAGISEASRNYLKEFKEKPKTIHYIAENWRKGGGARWGRRHIGFSLLALARIHHLIFRRKGIPPRPVLPKIFEFYQERYLGIRQKRMFRTYTPEELKSLRYIYFPLHKEPEMAINFQAPYCHDQKNLISYLSKTLPFGCRLLVREHRFNMGRRPTSYYKTLRSFPGVELISPLDPQFKYIQNADLVMTDNGSTGWEGLIMRRPVITLAPTFYSPPALDSSVTLKELNSEIIRLLSYSSPPVLDEYDRRLGWMIDSEWEATIPEDPDLVNDNLQRVESLVGKELSQLSSSVSAREMG